MNIILCGMPCSGKTYYGQIAAQQLGKDFIDTDQKIELEYLTQYGRAASCREITLKEGKSFFQDLEIQIIKKLIHASNSMIAIGGGTLCRPENSKILKGIGWILYLKTPSPIIMERILQKELLPSYLDPKNPQESFDRLLTERLPLYENNCHRSIDVEHENIEKIISAYSRKEKIHGK